MDFYLGTHLPNWLTHVEVPLFVSHRRLVDRRRLPRAVGRWALDSGAFSEVGLTGQFTTTPKMYVESVARYRDEIGGLDWAAPQDHMCEPFVLRKSKLAHDVAGAQRWTIDNYRTLRDLAPDLPIIPVLQGWVPDDYRRHVDAYVAAGVELDRVPLVGLGSVCRRQATTEIAALIAALSGAGLQLHAFGAKTNGLAQYGWCLASADSLAWSYAGRRLHRTCSVSGSINCANCLHYALSWRTAIITNDAQRPVQMEVPFTSHGT